MTVKIYGCRGSVAVSHLDSRYGGNTSCMKVTSGDESIVIDAGSGIMLLRDELRNNPSSTTNILISHLHLDHIIGLGTFDPAWDKNADVTVFTCSRDERPLNEQICSIFSPPYWPVSMKDFSAFKAVEIKEDIAFKIGRFTVTPFESGHPDKTLSFHITDGKKSLVHLLDSEISGLQQDELDIMEKYCKDANVVFFDAAYSSEDYLSFRKGWGHSTVKHGVELAKEWECKLMVFSHFDQKYSDDELDSWKDEFSSDKFLMAYDGLELSI